MTPAGRRPTCRSSSSSRADRRDGRIARWPLRPRPRPRAPRRIKVCLARSAACRSWSPGRARTELCRFEVTPVGAVRGVRPRRRGPRSVRGLAHAQNWEGGVWRAVRLGSSATPPASTNRRRDPRGERPRSSPARVQPAARNLAVRTSLRRRSRGGARHWMRLNRCRPVRAACRAATAFDASPRDAAEARFVSPRGARAARRDVGEPWSPRSNGSSPRPVPPSGSRTCR